MLLLDELVSCSTVKEGGSEAGACNCVLQNKLMMNSREYICLEIKETI